jgi:hypothetical protein
VSGRDWALTLVLAAAAAVVVLLGVLWLFDRLGLFGRRDGWD